VFKGRRRSKSSHRSQVQEGGCQVIWPEVLEKLNRMVESLQEEVPKFVSRWILWNNGRIKTECLSTLLSSGRIVTVRSGSTRVVDLVCEFTYRSLGNGVTSGLGRVLWIFDWKNPDTMRVIGSREAHNRRSRRRHDFRVGDL
jgi:hypothetical protein